MNFKSLIKRTAVLAGLCATSFTQAASFEALSKKDVAGGWAVRIDASGKLIAADKALISGASSEWNTYLARPMVAVLVTSPSGAIQFEGVFDLESLSSRYANLNGDENKGTTIDGRPLNHIIQELTMKYRATENMYVKAGLGTPTFGVGRSDRGARNLFATRPLQAKYAEIRERLFAEIGVQLDRTGTTMHLAVFDGTEQGVIDPNGKFKGTDFADVDFSGSRLSNSASAAATIEQKLGQSGLSAVVSYAYLRDLQPGADEQQRLAVGMKGAWAVRDWTLSALYQFVMVFGDTDVKGHLAEVQANKGRLTLYARGELMDEQDSRTVGASLGVAYKLVSRKNVEVTPFVELLVEDRDDADELNAGVLVGADVKFGAGTQVPRKSE